MRKEIRMLFTPFIGVLSGLISYHIARYALILYLHIFQVELSMESRFFIQENGHLAFYLGGVAGMLIYWKCLKK